MAGYNEEITCRRGHSSLPESSPVIGRSSSMRVSFILLFALFSSLGCEDQKNPVVPSSGNPKVAGSANDSSVKSDTRLPEDVPKDVGSATDTTAYSCNLFAQDCIDPTRGCYPVAGAGSCMWKGAIEAGQTCVLDKDSDFCLPGLTCIPISGLEPIGACRSLCQLYHPTTICETGYICTLLPNFPASSNVGYCELI
jgi:hypothetical protein